MANRAWPVNFVAVTSLLLLGARAVAHPEYAPSTVNHYLKVDLISAAELRLAYTVMVGPAPAAALRKAVDANADGRLDAAETRALGERQRAAVAAGLIVDVDGKRATLAFETPDVGLAGDEVAPSPLSVDLVARVALGSAGRHRLRIDDATADPQLGESEVRVEESPATRLVASHRGSSSDGERDGGKRETGFLFRGPRFSALEDRSITVVFEARPAAASAPRAAAHELRPGRLPKLIAMFLAVGIALLIARRMIRQRRR
jgi:hypothetical protein